jgi:hypothetical protein
MSEDQERLAAELKRAFTALPTGGPRFAAQPEDPPVSSESAGSISFTTSLLKAVLAGNKTETRRPVRPAPAGVDTGVLQADGSPIAPLACVGDRLWIREKWARLDDGSFVYAIDEPTPKVRWISPRFMPRAAARHHLLARSVGIARLDEIDDSAAIREGATAASSAQSPREWFISIWDSIYGEAEFASANNPWVWVIAFSLV